MQNAAAVLDLSVEDVYSKLKSNYDGYQFSPEAEGTVYTPWSVLSFLSDPKAGFKNYWYGTSGGIPTLLINYLRHDTHADEFMQLKKEGVYATKDSLEYRAEVDQIPLNSLLQQTGYYTLRAHSNKYVQLEFPNEEVEGSILRLTGDLRHMDVNPDPDLKLNFAGAAPR